MDLLADADGALQALDGDLAGEETLDDFDDEEGVFLVELPGSNDGFAERKAFDPDGSFGEANWTRDGGSLMLTGRGRFLGGGVTARLLA